jgi:hypothetical protein
MATVDDRDSLMRVLRDDRLLYPGIDEKMAGQQDVPDLAGMVGRSWQAKERRMSHGKKIGKFKVTTVLAEYDLDVRLDMEGNQFVILVPGSPGEAINPSNRRNMANYDSFKAPTLGEAKEAARAFLVSRDTTDFIDVIEYTCSCPGIKTYHSTDSENRVGFDFRVARVSVAQDKIGRPKLEIPVEVDGDGKIAVSVSFGETCKPHSHQWKHDQSMGFTVDRWRKCRAIEDGIASLGKMLANLLGPDGNEVGAKLDAIDAEMCEVFGSLEKAGKAVRRSR